MTTVTSPAIVGNVGLFVQGSQTKPTNWWAGLLGRELINAWGLTDGRLTLGQWLATTFPKLYGGMNAACDLSSFSNAQVAAFYANLYQMPSRKLDTEVMATALSVFATTLLPLTSSLILRPLCPKPLLTAHCRSRACPSRRHARRWQAGRGIGCTGADHSGAFSLTSASGLLTYRWLPPDPARPSTARHGVVTPACAGRKGFSEVTHENHSGIRASKRPPVYECRPSRGRHQARRRRLYS